MAPGSAQEQRTTSLGPTDWTGDDGARFAGPSTEERGIDCERRVKGNRGHGSGREEKQGEQVPRHRSKRPKEGLSEAFGKRSRA